MWYQIAAVPAAFGPGLCSDGISAKLVVGTPIHGEEDFKNEDSMEGAVVYVKRGKVSFVEKARRAQKAGAVAVVVSQHVDVWPYTMVDSKTNGEGITIPIVMVRKEHGER